MEEIDLIISDNLTKDELIYNDNIEDSKNSDTNKDGAFNQADIFFKIRLLCAIANQYKQVSDLARQAIVSTEWKRKVFMLVGSLAESLTVLFPRSWDLFPKICPSKLLEAD